MSKRYIEFESDSLPKNAYANIYVLGKYEFEDDEDLIVYQKDCSIIDAIPIEWFQKYIDRNNPEWNYDFCYVVLKILEDWEKENE